MTKLWQEKTYEYLKKSDRTKLIKLLDDVFQIYIRYRDNWTCIICNIYIPFNKQEMHAGHYIDRSIRSTRWDEMNVNAQCRKCNSYEHFSKDKGLYTEAIIHRYGQEGLNKLLRKRKCLTKYSIGDIITLILFYQDCLNKYIQGG